MVARNEIERRIEHFQGRLEMELSGLESADMVDVTFCRNLTLASALGRSEALSAFR